MNYEWIEKQIFCKGKRISPALKWKGPLLPCLKEVSYKIRLVMKSFEMESCEGRQLSCDDVDIMKSFEERLGSEEIDEESLREIVVDFGNYLPRLLEGDTIEIDSRALKWAKRK